MSLPSFVGSTVGALQAARDMTVNQGGDLIGVSGLSGKLSDWANNALTGERDYNRELELQHDAQAFNSAEAVKAYEREREARQTAFQDTVADLKKAGLSPGILYGSGGSATAFPSVSSARSGQGHAGRSGDGLTNLLRSFVSLAGTAILGTSKLSAAALTAASAGNTARSAAEAARLDLEARFAAGENIRAFKR